MKHEINLIQLGEILTSKARAANRETVRYYGSDQPDMKRRMGFIAQVALIRELGISVELGMSGEDGKEVYTRISLGSCYEWTL